MDNLNEKTKGKLNKKTEGKPVSLKYLLVWAARIVIVLSVIPIWIYAFWLADLYRDLDGRFMAVISLALTIMSIIFDMGAKMGDNVGPYMTLFNATKPKGLIDEDQ